jgi:hypothetical protein
MQDPLSLTSSLGARLVLALALCAALWLGVWWALA